MIWFPALFIVIAGVIITGAFTLTDLQIPSTEFSAADQRKKYWRLWRTPDLELWRYGIFFPPVFKDSIYTGYFKNFTMENNFVMPVFGRLGMIWCAGISNYAREKPGMGSGHDRFTSFREILNLPRYYNFNYLSCLWRGIISLWLQHSVQCGFYKIICRKSGGTTGRYTGACTELSEIVVLFTFLVIEKILFLKGFLCWIYTTPSWVKQTSIKADYTADGMDVDLNDSE